MLWNEQWPKSLSEAKVKDQLKMNASIFAYS